jgi:hypothetical protein
LGVRELVQRVFEAVPWKYEKWPKALVIFLDRVKRGPSDKKLEDWFEKLSRVEKLEELEALQPLSAPENQGDLAERRRLLEAFFAENGDSSAEKPPQSGKSLLHSVFETLFAPLMKENRLQEIILYAQSQGSCCGLRRKQDPCTGCHVGTDYVAKQERKSTQEPSR